jgi:HAD superfamily hydrolase (TIGR01490 family)
MKAAFFDLDKTVIARSSGLAFGRDLYREGLISKRVLLRGIAAQFVYLLVGADENKMEQMREKVLALTKGWEKSKVEKIVADVMGDVITPIIYREALELIEKHRSEGTRVFIVSSSPEEIVKPLGELLEVDGFIASRARIDVQGRYTGELDFYCYGPNKVTAIKELAADEGIDLTNSYAYSDSITDLPMLEVVGHPVPANPDRELRKIATDRGWQIVRFTRPVTIRKRLAEFAPSPKTTALGSGVAISLAAGVAGYVWLRRRSSRTPERTRLNRAKDFVVSGAASLPGAYRRSP